MKQIIIAFHCYLTALFLSSVSGAPASFFFLLSQFHFDTYANVKFSYNASSHFFS